MTNWTGCKGPLRALAVTLWLEVLTLHGQPAAPVVNLSEQPGIQAFAAGVRGMRRSSDAAEPVKSEVDKLLSEASTLQSSGQAARREGGWRKPGRC